MRIAILSRSSKIHSTRRLVETAASLGHEPLVINPLKCRISLGRKRPEIWFEGRKVTGVDVVIPRIGASITEFGLAVVRQFEVMGVPSLNESQAVARSRDKMRALQLLSRHDIGIPKTVMTGARDKLGGFIKDVGGPPVILKILQGTQGVGVMLCDSVDSAESVLDTMYAMGQNILIQQYIRESKGRDVRALVVDGQVVAAMSRQAALGEFRANIHRGGLGTVIELDPEYRRTAIEAVRVMGLAVAGVDMLISGTGPLVVELNHSPGLQGIERASGIDVARLIIEAAERCARKVVTGLGPAAS